MTVLGLQEWFGLTWPIQCALSMTGAEVNASSPSTFGSQFSKKLQKSEPSVFSGRPTHLKLERLPLSSWSWTLSLNVCTVHSSCLTFSWRATTSSSACKIFSSAYPVLFECDNKSPFNGIHWLLPTYWQICDWSDWIAMSMSLFLGVVLVIIRSFSSVSHTVSHSVSCAGLRRCFRWLLCKFRIFRWHSLLSNFPKVLKLNNNDYGQLLEDSLRCLPMSQVRDLHATSHQHAIQYLLTIL